MSLNLAILESALTKISSRLHADKNLRNECITRLANEIVNPSEGYQTFRAWYEDVMCDFKGQITFSETINLMKYCELLVSCQTYEKIVQQLHNNLYFNVPTDKEKWARDLLVIERNKATANLQLLTEVHGDEERAIAADSDDTDGKKSKWSRVKSLVNQGYIHKLKVVKLSPAKILPDEYLSDVRRGHTFLGKPSELAHVETRSKTEMPIRPYMRQRSKSFDDGSKRFVLRALSMSQPGSPRDSDDDDGPDIFDHDEKSGSDKLPPIEQRGSRSPSTGKRPPPGNFRSPKKPSQHGMCIQDTITEEKLPQKSPPQSPPPHRYSDSSLHVSPPAQSLDGVAMERRRTTGHSLRGHVVVNLPPVAPPPPVIVDTAPSTLPSLQASVPPKFPAKLMESDYCCPPKAGGRVVMRTKSSDLCSPRSPPMVEDVQPVGLHPPTTHAKMVAR
jgi:hypothetical protein